MAKRMQSEDGSPAEEPSLQERMFGAVRPEDENTYPNSPRNYIAQQLGLGPQWQMSRADEKQYNQELPTMMGMGAMGRMRDVTAPVAEAATSAASALAPELRQWAQNMMANPQGRIEVSGAMDMPSFQRLRDALGHVGPIVVKGK